MNTSGTGSPKGDDGLDEEVFWEDGQRYVRDRLGNVIIEEDSPEREVDEKTMKVLEERERNRIRRERREAKHRAPGYEPPEGSDVSTDSQLSEDEQERDKAIRKERKRQEIKAMKKREDKAAANRMARQIREERKSTAVISGKERNWSMNDSLTSSPNTMERVQSTEKMGYLQSCDPDLLRAMCECVWFEEVDEGGLKIKIDEILNTPTHSFGITEADLDNYCKGLRMPAQGSVASRLGQFMKQVNDVIDKYALQQDLKVKGSLKMFLKAVVYCIDPPGLSNLVRFEIKKEPIDSMTAFAKLPKLHMERIEASDRLIQQQEQMEKKKRSPPMGWTNGDVNDARTLQ
ncbi:hypothetical protein AC1031_014736 [Aphanomyces cochlioides]|nr:hypothetical protein AC1031_014736 [Aphanomyces cochlioides]